MEIEKAFSAGVSVGPGGPETGAEVLMRAGQDLPQTLRALRAAGTGRANCGLPSEKACSKLEPAAEKAGYFTTILVKER